MYQTVTRLLPLWLALFCLSTASAQLGGGNGNTGGQQTGGNNGGQQTGGQGTGGSTGGTTGGPREIGDPRAGMAGGDAFSAVDRGDTVGAGTGSDAAFGAGANTATGAAGGLGRGIGGGLGGFGALNDLFGQQGTIKTSRPVIRTRLRTAIAAPAISRAQLQRDAMHHLHPQSPTSQRFQNVHVDVQGNTVILSGVVNDNRDRRMSELLMRLEPGIRHVDNRVTTSGQ